MTDKENMSQDPFHAGAAKASTAGQEPSLQEAFAAFRAQRKAELVRARRLALAQANRVRTREEKEALRQKFMDQVLSYRGVPYAKRYQEPGSKWPSQYGVGWGDKGSPTARTLAGEHYDAPLFLDCCGLVRRCVRDLKEDFGFDIGSWNQAYQFDTLPIALEPEQMRPGDLVFIAADYIKENKKPQRHRMVHVEVW